MDKITEYIGSASRGNTRLLSEETSGMMYRRNDKSLISAVGSMGRGSSEDPELPRVSKVAPERINQRKAKLKTFLRQESTSTASSAESEYQQLIDFSTIQGVPTLKETPNYAVFDRTSMNSAGVIEFSSSFEERDAKRIQMDEDLRKKKKEKAAIGFVRPMRINLKPYQIEELKEAFNMLENGMELIEIVHVPTVIRACGFEPDIEEVKDILDEIKPMTEGFLNLNELIRVFEAKLKREDPLEEIRRAFKVFDLNNTGMITLDNLKEISKCVGEEMHEEEMKEMISAADKTHSGGVTMENFVKLITRKDYFD